MSITHQKLQKEQEKNLKKNFLKSSNQSSLQKIQIDQASSVSITTSQAEQKIYHEIQNNQNQPIIIQQQSNIKEQDILKKNKDQLKQILKPIRSQIQNLTNKLNKKENVETQINQTQNLIQNLSQYEYLVPKTQIEAYKALVFKFQHQVVDLQTQNSQFFEPSKMNTQHENIQQNVNNEQQKQNENLIRKQMEQQQELQQKILQAQNDLEKINNQDLKQKAQDIKEDLKVQLDGIDFIVSKKAIMKRLGGEFDYEGIQVEISDITKQIQEIDLIYRKKANLDFFEISQRDFQAEINTLTAIKEQTFLADLKKKYKINLKNYNPQFQQVKQKPQQQESYLNQIQTVPQMPNQDIRLQFQDYEPLLVNDYMKKPVLTHEQPRQENQQDESRTIQQYEQLQKMIENQNKLTAQQQMQINLLMNKIEEKLSQPEFRYENIKENKFEQLVQKDSNKNNIDLIKQNLIIEKNMIKQVVAEDNFQKNEVIPKKQELTQFQEMNLQIAKEKLGEILFQIQQDKGDQISIQDINKQNEQQQQQQQQFQQNYQKNENFLEKKPIQQEYQPTQAQPGQSNELMENFMKMANQLVIQMTQKITKSIDETIQNKIQVPKIENFQLGQQQQAQQFQQPAQILFQPQFDLNLDHLTPLVQPHFARKNLLKDLLCEYNEDNSYSNQGTSLSESIFQLGNDYSKSDGQLSGPEYQVLQQQIKNNDDILKSIITDSELSFNQ